VSEINRLVNIGNAMKACNTTGTETNAGYPEASFNWDVAMRTEAILEQAGATVVLTRQNNTGWGPCIDQRAAIANQAHAAATVSIHGDGASATDRGFHVIYPVPLAGLNADIAGPSKQLAVDLRDAFAAGTSMPISNYAGSDGLNPRSDIGGLNLAKVPAVLIECGNMRNATDAALLTDPAWRQRAAAAIARGIANFVSP
jgi:N-acetylmuramoyl-L-alanine amidase